MLEERQTTLGFSSYSIDCSSLEQVLHNICQQADDTSAGIEYGNMKLFCCCYYCLVSCGVRNKIKERRLKD
jgi:hypothetical protein